MAQNQLPFMVALESYGNKNKIGHKYAKEAKKELKAELKQNPSFVTVFLCNFAPYEE